MSKRKYTIKNLKVSDLLMSIITYNSKVLPDFNSIEVNVGHTEGGYMEVRYLNRNIIITSNFKYVHEFAIFGEYQFDINALGVDMLVPMYNITRRLVNYSESQKAVFLVALMLAHEIGHVLDAVANSCYDNRKIQQDKEMVMWEIRHNKIRDGILNDSLLGMTVQDIEKKWYKAKFDLENDYRNLPLENVADFYGFELIKNMTLKDFYGF